MDYMNLDDFSDGLIDLAATGLVADMSSMASPENRAICDKAFKNLKNPGIKKINGGYAFVSRNISFGVAPKINAANRVNHNDLAMNVFLSDDEDEIAEIVKGLNKCREEQNAVVDSIMPSLEEQAQEQLDNKCMFFFIPDDVEASVSGLIGNKLLERYNRPLLVLKKYGDEFSGSMRAIGVESFKEYCDRTGICWCSGHENAAGIGIPISQFEEFKEAEHSLNGYSHKYVKGLGGLSNEESKEMYHEPIFHYFKLDDMSESMFRKWFNKDDSDTRKQMLND